MSIKVFKYFQGLKLLLIFKIFLITTIYIYKIDIIHINEVKFKWVENGMKTKLLNRN